jgi:hypothetical protein
MDVTGKAIDELCKDNIKILHKNLVPLNRGCRRSIEHF